MHSVYYALYGRNTNLYEEGYHRALVSSYAFPEKTKITMLDIIEGSPRYYYHIITKEEEENAINDIRAHNETSYDFSLFTTMGSIGSSKNYSDTEMNQIYYHNGSSDEEFIFIVDFSEANIPTNKLNNSLLVELRNNDNQNKQFQMINIGSTDQRPLNPQIGTSYYDTTINKPLWYFDNHWRQYDGTQVD